MCTRSKFICTRLTFIGARSMVIYVGSKFICVRSKFICTGLTFIRARLMVIYVGSKVTCTRSKFICAMSKSTQFCWQQTPRGMMDLEVTQLSLRHSGWVATTSPVPFPFFLGHLVSVVFAHPCPVAQLNTATGHCNQ